MRVLYYPSYDDSELDPKTVLNSAEVRRRDSKTAMQQTSPNPDRTRTRTLTRTLTRTQVRRRNSTTANPQTSYPGKVTLNLTKASILVGRAVALQSEGFAMPVPAVANANLFDEAYAELVRLTNGLAHRVRNNDDVHFASHAKGGRVSYSIGCTHINSIHVMLFGLLAHTCPWAPYVEQVVRKFDL